MTPPVKPKILAADLNHDGCAQCVEFVQSKIPSFPRPIYYARNLRTNTDLPAIGAVIKTNESTAGHLGIILSYDEETVTFEEYNYINCAYSKRTLRRDDPRILGYWWPPIEPPIQLPTINL